MENKHKPNNLPRRECVLPHIWDVTDLLKVVQNHGDRTLFRYFEGKELLSMTYVAFEKKVYEMAAAFKAMNLEGEKIVIIGDTSPQWVCASLASLASGCVAVPMDKELDIEEIRKFFGIVNAKAVVYSKGFNEKFIKSIEANDTSIQYFIPINPAYNSDFDHKVITYEEVLACGRERIEREGYDYPILHNRETLAEMLFTSGTTGTSKCVMLCQKNIFAAVNSAVETVCFYPDDVLVSVLPVHHTYELMCLMAAMVYGMEICINDSLRHVMRNFKLFKPTGLVLVPLFINTMYKAIWSEAEKSGRSKALKTGLALSKTLMSVGIDKRRSIFKAVHEAFGGRLERIICGGAKLNPDLIAAFEDFGICICEGFGITECSPLVSVDRYYNHKWGSVGPAVPACSIRISEEFSDGTLNDKGFREGELQVKGDNVMLGYYNNDEANEASFTKDGWYRTGDVGYMDEEGYVFITGRCKSVIVLENGKNVFPEEIEEYLTQIDTIAEVVVVGRKAKDSDEVILTALVYPNVDKFPTGATKDLIQESIRNSINQTNRRLPTFKQIKAVELRDTEFEKTPTRKIKRFLVK